MKYALALLWLLLTIPLNAQNSKKVRGVATDKANRPLVDASVIVSGTTRGTLTDFNGRFDLTVPPNNAYISAPFLGYKQVDVSISSSSSLSRSSLQSTYANSYNRWSVTAFGGVSISSAAITNPMGLSGDFGGKPWGGLKVGFRFLRIGKSFIDLCLGGAYRDYGFRENTSSIPYISGLAQLQLRRRLFWRIGFFSYVGGEYAKLYTKGYRYYNPVNLTNTHNLFIHSNDLYTLTYGGGLSVYINRFTLNFGFEQNQQMDANDLTYGQTAGGRFANLGLMYQF